MLNEGLFRCVNSNHNIQQHSLVRQEIKEIICCQPLMQVDYISIQIGQEKICLKR